MNSGVIWEAQRHLALLCCYTAAIDGLDGVQTQEAIQKAIKHYNNGKPEGWFPAIQKAVSEMQPSDPRTSEVVLLSDINRICNVIRLPMPEQKGFIAASIWKETAGTMQPVEEAFWLSPAKREAELKSRSYYPHYGMGDLQITWPTNYRWVSSLFTPASAYLNGEIQPNYPTNFIENPTALLDPEVSLIAAIVGMNIGFFRRNHTIKRYINEDKVDFYNARKTTNGLVPGVAKEIEEKSKFYTEKFRGFDHE